MIAERYITEWSDNFPWTKNSFVEQDIRDPFGSRTLCATKRGAARHQARQICHGGENV